MQFIKVVDAKTGTAALVQHLTRELKRGRRVLWLVPGGSNIPISVDIMHQLPDNLTQHLSILLCDERYGDPGHANSNYEQLQNMGFEHKQATFMPALVHGLTQQEVTHRYDELVAHAFESAEVTIGQFGIGTDGHIAGILPHSPAVRAEAMVTSYEAPPHIRLTMTPVALHRLHAAYAFVFGADKRQALHRLQAEVLPLDDQPSQILKQLPEAYVYNDQIGGSNGN